jgi:hypothetical protein
MIVHFYMYCGHGLLWLKAGVRKGINTAITTYSGLTVGEDLTN